MSERIGFVGVGLMGEGMAASLMKAGYPVTVMAHRNRAPVERLVAAGAAEATDLAGIAQASDIVHLCAPGSPQVEAVVEALLPHLAPGTVVIDCSTSEPTSTARLAERLDAAGCALADAPLGGTPAQAVVGGLSTMVGAAPEVFARIEPVLAAWAGAGIVHLGPTGTGHKMKLLMNFLSLGYGAIYAEALTLSAKVGISPQQFDSVMRGSRMGCGFYETFMGYAVHGDREAHKFTLTNALKDISYLASMAEAEGVANPVGAAIKGSYDLAVGAGGDGAEDYVPHLVDFIAQANDVER